MSSYYRLISRTQDAQGVARAEYEPTKHAQGVWNPQEQHMAPATGILCRELELYGPRPELRVARLNLDIWGMIHFAPFTVETRLLRPGRTIELVEVRLLSAGKTCIVAHAWRLQTCDSSSVQGLEDPPLPARELMHDWQEFSGWGGGYISSLQLKTDAQSRAGHARVWLKNELEMVEGQATSDFVRLMGMVDTANGVAARAMPHQWIFPNVDLNINLLRMPQGRWLGLETRQQFGSDGIGLTSSVLHDDLGVFGHSEQTLTLRAMG